MTAGGWSSRIVPMRAMKQARCLGPSVHCTGEHIAVGRFPRACVVPGLGPEGTRARLVDMFAAEDHARAVYAAAHPAQRCDPSRTAGMAGDAGRDPHFAPDMVRAYYARTAIPAPKRKEPKVTTRKSRSPMAHIPPAATIVPTVDAAPVKLARRGPELTCACGKAFRILGDETMGATYHATWTRKSGTYGPDLAHYIPAVR